MKHEFVSRTGARRLILVYAGWAMDAVPFRNLRRPGYDVAVLWDYRDFSIDWSFLSPYNEICIFAWSLGVYAASVTCQSFAGRTTCRIAVNGTLSPVDRSRGIPPAVFAGTANGLNERQLYKFYRRVCGGGEIFRIFLENKPQRDVNELVDELHVFLDDNIFVPQQETKWDYAVISSEDAIFPPVNQWRSWRVTPMIFIDGPHLPDFQRIIDRFIIDKDMTEARFVRGLKSYDSEASVQARVVVFLDRLVNTPVIASRIRRQGARVLEIGSGTGTLSSVLDNVCGNEAYLEMWDIAGEPPVEGRLRRFRNVDAELEIRRIPDSSFDLVATASTVQWFNSPSRFLSECARILAPGGFIILSTFVKGNLRQISDSTGKSLPLLTKDQWKTIIPAGMRLIGMKCYEHELEFSSSLDVFRHLRQTGVDSLGRSADSVNPVAAVRHLQPDLDGKFRLTYKPLVMVLVKE